MLKKVTVILLIFVCLLALIAGGTVLAFRAFFSEQRLKKMTVNGIRGYTQRDASVGHMALDPFSGLRVDDLAVSSTAGFRKGKLLSMKRLHLRPQLFPLLHRRLNISTLTLEGPRLDLSLADGAFAGKAPARRRGAMEKAAGAPLLLITKLAVRDGTVLLPGDAGRRDLNITGLAIDAQGISPLAPFDADLSFRFAGHIRCRGRVTVNIRENLLTLHDLTLSSGGATAHVSGTVRDPADPRAVEFDLHLKGDRACFEELLGIIAGNTDFTLFAFPEVNLSVSGSPGRLKIAFAKTP